MHPTKTTGETGILDVLYYTWILRTDTVWNKKREQKRLSWESYFPLRSYEDYSGTVALDVSSNISSCENAHWNGRLYFGYISIYLFFYSGFCFMHSSLCAQSALCALIRYTFSEEFFPKQWNSGEQGDL